ncbi:uncharacterized protein LOC126680694 [Mercurialis annua]|uniref:uncharacterized protein LOC126680694 n=1 Tax=Mercurialis annua TaxID=3986 RepID=UPI002160D270|nr:uncharacterized protein LOC126680694 [Mercurialis annua]
MTNQGARQRLTGQSLGAYILGVAQSGTDCAECCRVPCDPSTSYLRTDSATAVGACVVRNHWGKVFSVCARRFSHVSSPTIAEALALREAICLANRLRVSEPIFEGDAKGITDAMAAGSGVGLDCDVILQDCRTLVCNFFPLSHSFKFVRRSLNWAAHSIVGKAFRDHSFCCNTLAQMEWLESRLCSRNNP